MSVAAEYDVAVVGAGIAGLAACVLLRQQGLRVVCLDAHPYPHHKVGESLDWSSPGLLRRLGIDVEALVADGIATPKKKISAYAIGEPGWTVAPPPAIKRQPLRFEINTLHVDRSAVDQRVFERARALGADFIWERIDRVETEGADEGERVRRLVTAQGREVQARWYIDASGTARVFARDLHIPVTAYGPAKVCLWTYFDTAPLHDGTAFFIDNSDPYLNWIWDIPISPSQTSVGFVVTADRVRDERKAGNSIEVILTKELRRHRRFDALLDATPLPAVTSTSFQSSVTSRVCGPNWFMAGEAASMPDPLTGNGFTSGIRHARWAVDAIRAAGPGNNVNDVDEIPGHVRRSYSRQVLRLGRSFNAHIESAIYRPEIRQAFGFKSATYAYTFFAFFMNALYARFDPRGPIGMAAFGLLFAAARAWIAGWTLAARVARSA